MKTLIFFGAILMSMTSFAQSVKLDGAYLSKSGDKNTLWLFKNGYSSMITYQDNQYVSTQGGPYTFDGKSLVISLEYNDANSESVGSQSSLPSSLKNKSLTIDGQSFAKQPAKDQGLDGIWRITGRQNAEGTISDIPRGDRKTIKILVDGFFQWIAINPATKDFYGTGGGKYSFENDQYTENILFFSRDNTRVGAKLDFKGEIKDRAWHHSGLSSKGVPIHEIWSVD